MQQYIPTIVNTLIGLVIGSLFTYLSSRVKNYKTKEKKESQDLNLVKNALCCMQRNTLLEKCEEYLENGYCNDDSKQVLNDLYKSYSSLGGNGLVSQLVYKINLLPSKKKK